MATLNASLSRNRLPRCDFVKLSIGGAARSERRQPQPDGQGKTGLPVRDAKNLDATNWTSGRCSLSEAMSLAA
jgi:hypothetical protein